MNRRFAVAVTFAAVTLCAAGATSPASAAAVHAPMHAMFSKTKMIKLNLRNDTGSPVKLKAGDASVTLDAGKVMPLKLAEGTSITVEEATAHHPAGSVLTQVSTALEGATLVIN